jgi:hypothetical protein
LKFPLTPSLSPLRLCRNRKKVIPNPSFLLRVNSVRNLYAQDFSDFLEMTKTQIVIQFHWGEGAKIVRRKFSDVDM